ncbi:hypothetical protein [Mangrovihabitans endophyticus]|uniref:Uncharacterized protein n=1 Tax=Mangrovihabitans endophyticus TaxID=1751298 RepID=A0A8J3C0M3_9ACTN|nr:hypothetical protein [Mangrovihabitans endophyticus]GGL00529.1 hypothetical protein GCM10012284_38710 [Mangrovihabitans endophyticus]
MIEAERRFIAVQGLPSAVRARRGPPLTHAVRDDTFAVTTTYVPLPTA